MNGHTENTVLIDAPIDYVWRLTNDVRDWPNLFSEYAAVDVLEEGDGRVVFRLTMHPDEQGRVWSWVSERSWDEDRRLVRARRIEKGPFEFMNITWTYEAIEADRTAMHWIQDFEMKEGAPVDTATMTARINENTRVQMSLIKNALETRRLHCHRFEDVPSNTKRGGDLRALLTPATVGCSSGFSGSVRIDTGDQVNEHYHPYSEEFLYVVEGRLRIDLNGDPLEAGAGDSLFIPREVRHRLVNVGTDEALVVFHLSPLAPAPPLGHVDTEESVLQVVGGTP